jgi:hypothetical protein
MPRRFPFEWTRRAAARGQPLKIGRAAHMVKVHLQDFQRAELSPDDDAVRLLKAE